MKPNRSWKGRGGKRKIKEVRGFANRILQGYEEKSGE